ncbi:MAG: alpha amylase C-terminal domain-containing protein [Lentimicrobiaceae bacterium]|jgi:1,4-alpha-glucan branching enzyme|nr:alpha amylase C-terminal domain-containing protein [Lentimicrobiaceae bacterium]
MTKPMLIVEQDPWLEPISAKVTERYNRFLSKLYYLTGKYGSLRNFASAYQLFGFNYDGVRKGWWYREWAPAAYALYLTGDFNAWNRYEFPLSNTGYGIWEIFLPDKTFKDSLIHGSFLKVIVKTQIGETDRIPVYSNRVVQDENNKDFKAQFWNPKSTYQFKNTQPKRSENDPLLIYEVHIGMAQEKQNVGTYDEFAETVLPHIVDSGYNAIQLMAIAEHPYYGSFGYHVSNFFAASSRFGTPESLQALIDKAHGMGLLVIMDIVHSHTVKNTREGINLFDGTDFQYTHGGNKGNHPLWDSKLFNYGKEEVLQFLLSNVRYWIELFRFDGFRFDGITSMIYTHHGINDTIFDKPYNYFDASIDNDAITYLQLANQLIHEYQDEKISIAEEVTGMPGLCSPTVAGGIGFDYRLGMGIPDFWIKLLKDQKDEEWDVEAMFRVMTNRRFDIKTIAYAESHDQALVGDKTIAFRLMDKEMYFNMDKKSNNLVVDRGIALHKMIRFFTIVLGGEAWLNFMGNEFGHPEWIDFPRVGNNWSYQYAQRQWSLLKNKQLKYHWLADFDKAMLQFVKKNKIMTALPPWLLKTDNENKTLVFERNNLIFVFNWSSEKSISSYEIPIKKTGNYKIIFSTDAVQFGGFNRIDTTIHYPSYERDGQEYMKIYNISRAAFVLKRVE